MGLVMGQMSDSANVATIVLFGHYYATTELPKVIEYDPITLETYGTVDLSHMIPGLVTMTPHCQHDQDGTAWNIGIAIASTIQPEYVVFKVTPPKSEAERMNPWLNLQIVKRIPSPKQGSIPYFHSFFMTENYLVIPEHPWSTCNVSGLFMVIINPFFNGSNLRLFKHLMSNLGIYYEWKKLYGCYNVLGQRCHA